jgi:hypothetical protein
MLHTCGSINVLATGRHTQHAVSGGYICKRYAAAPLPVLFLAA